MYWFGENYIYKWLNKLYAQAFLCHAVVRLEGREEDAAEAHRQSFVSIL